MPAVRAAPVRITEPLTVKDTAAGAVRPVESAAPAARRAPAPTRKADQGDGSAIIDWLLQKER